MSRFGQWFVGILAQHVLLQILAAFPAAYLLGLVVASRQKGTAVFNAIPPVFWPILAVLVLIVTVYHGCAYPMYKKHREKLEAYRQEVETAHNWVSKAYKPEILDPEHQGNPDAIKEYAQNAIDVLRPKLMKKRKGTDIPQRIDAADKNSLNQWYDYLRKERARTAQ